MLKKVLISLGVVLLLSFISCGGGSSKEARELLSKILQLVGIPHNIVVNICQDSNRDGICGAGELFTKVTIKKGESVEDIWKKITLTDDGRYFLETYDETLPILLEVQDTANLDFDDSKFTLTFNGFETKEENETKELSILESMVDANALSKDIADKFRTLDNAEAQDKYYASLFNALETNINTLRRNDLDKEEAIIIIIKEMADETITNQEQANRINGCDDDQSCIDEEIQKLFNELIITNEELLEIKGKNNLTPTSTPTPIAGEEEIVYDGKWVKPSRSVCEGNGGTYVKYSDYNECTANWENGESICIANGDILPDIGTLKAVVTDCGGETEEDNYDEWQRNKNNESYQACYDEKGFSSEHFSFYWWSKTQETGSSRMLVINFAYGIETAFSNYETTLNVRCIREE